MFNPPKWDWDEDDIIGPDSSCKTIFDFYFQRIERPTEEEFELSPRYRI